MAKFATSLESLHIAAPCKAEWDEMLGDERVRFCGQCSKNVYNLSNMSRREAQTLVSNREGGMCVRFYRRSDGTVLTQNCPVGLRLIKRKLSRTARAMISAILSFTAGVGVYFGLMDVDTSAITPVQLVETAPDDAAQPDSEEFTAEAGGI